MEPTATNGANAGCTCEEALRIARVTGESVVPTFCAMCGPSAGCGLYAFTKAGRMTRVVGMEAEAALVEAAVRSVLAEGYRTQDIRQKGDTPVGTVAMGDLVAAKVRTLPL